MRRNGVKMLAVLLALIMLLAALGACAKSEPEPQPAETSEPAEATETAETEAVSERQDGEQYDVTLMIEGMEETVKYQHVRNETAGFAMGFECESFVRQSEPDRERFVSIYDDPQNPENYLEVSFSPEDAETVIAAVTEELSADYALNTDTAELDNGSTCTRIDASATADGTQTADVLQAVYVIPAGDGCRVARLRYVPEGSDGFGRRLSNMVNTISVFDAA